MRIIKEGKARTASEDKALRDTVSDIIYKVRTEGDSALREYSRTFDGAERNCFRVSPEEIKAAYSKMSESEMSDLREALANIEAFARAQKDTLHAIEDFSPKQGIHLGHRVIPVSSCCCYVPGGRYPLYSTALMLITPAKVAGVKRICATSPVIHGTEEINYKT